MKKVIVMILMLLPMLAWGQSNTNLPDILLEELANINDERIVSMEELSKTHEVVSERSSGDVTQFQDKPTWIDEWFLRAEVFCKGKDIIERTLSVRIPFTYGSPTDIPENSPILVKLNDDSTIEGKALTNADYMPREYSSYISQHVIPTFVFSKEDMSKMRTKGIKKIRIAVGQKRFDKEISKEASLHISDGFLFLDNWVKSRPSLYDDF